MGSVSAGDSTARPKTTLSAGGPGAGVRKTARAGYHARVIQPRFKATLEALRDAVEHVYGPRLVTLAAFGSVGRGTASPESDIDLLLIVRELPPGRMPRVAEFERVEELLGRHPDTTVRALSRNLSAVFKTPEEAEAGSPLFLDMLDDARLLVDRGDFFRRRLERLRRRLEELGARKIQQGDRWYWDLKPDYQPGEIFEL